MPLNLSEFRRLAGLDSTTQGFVSRVVPLREDFKEAYDDNAGSLIELELGLVPGKPTKETVSKTKRRLQEKRVAKRHVELPLKKPPTFRELYEENGSLKRENQRLREDIDGLTCQVRQLSEEMQRGNYGRPERDPTRYAEATRPWEMRNENGFRQRRVRESQTLREFREHTGIQADEFGRRVDTRMPRNAHNNGDSRVPYRDLPGMTQAAQTIRQQPRQPRSRGVHSVRPDQMSETPSLFPSFSHDETPRSDTASSRSDPTITRWETLDTDERPSTQKTPSKNSGFSPRFASAVDEAHDPSRPITTPQTKHAPTNPRFEGILTEHHQS